MPSIIPLLPSAARTATPTAVEIRDIGRNQGLIVVVNATAVTATPAVTVTIAGVDVVSGAAWTILSSTAIATVSTTVLKVRPGITAAANVAASDALPPVVRVSFAHGDADSITYSATAYLTN